MKRHLTVVGACLLVAALYAPASPAANQTSVRISNLELVERNADSTCRGLNESKRAIWRCLYATTVVCSPLRGYVTSFAIEIRWSKRGKSTPYRTIDHRGWSERGDLGGPDLDGSFCPQPGMRYKIPFDRALVGPSARMDSRQSNGRITLCIRAKATGVSLSRLVCSYIEP